MGRIEGMADDEARAVAHALLQGADEEARRARREHRVRAKRRIDPTVELALERRVLRRVLLHEDGAFHRFRRIVDDADPRRIGARREPEPFHRRPGGVDEGAKPGIGVRRRIPGRDREAAREEVSRPACADGPGAEQCDGADCGRCGPCHGCLPELSGGPSACRPCRFCRRTAPPGVLYIFPRARGARLVPSAPADRKVGAARCRGRASWRTRW